MLLLLVGIAERRVHLGGTAGVGNGAQRLHRPGSIAFFVVEVRQCGDGFFRVGLQLHRGLELALCLLQVVIQTVETAEQKMIVDIAGLDFDDLFILLNRQLQHAIRAAAAVAGLHIA